MGDRWDALQDAFGRDPAYHELKAGLLKSYFLDEASLWAARALEVQPGQQVLDLCAAPGGKSLVLALALGGQGELTANDRSSARRARLHRVLEEHLPPELYQTVKVTGHDAVSWGIHRPDRYDRVLLDAPCSSERHVFESPGHRSRWTESRTKVLARQAYAMAASALLTVKPGGMVVYSTCALSPLENDAVMDRLAKKKGDGLEFLPARAPWGEPTERGWQIWPDSAEGRGPIYFARFRKREIKEEGDE